MELRKLTHEMRLETEEDVAAMIDKFKEESEGIVTYKTAYKDKKVKGEVIDTWYILTITEDFTK